MARRVPARKPSNATRSPSSPRSAHSAKGSGTPCPRSVPRPGMVGVPKREPVRGARARRGVVSNGALPDRSYSGNAEAAASSGTVSERSEPGKGVASRLSVLTTCLLCGTDAVAGGAGNRTTAVSAARMTRAARSGSRATSSASARNKCANGGVAQSSSLILLSISFSRGRRGAWSRPHRLRSRVSSPRVLIQHTPSRQDSSGRR